MTTPAEPKLPVSLRLSLPEGAGPRIGARQLAWVCVQALATAGLALAGVWAAQPALAFALALALALLAGAPSRWFRAPVVLAGAMLGALIGQELGLSPLLSVGVAVGVGAAWLETAPLTRWRALQGALAVWAGAGLGGWAATSVLPHGPSNLGEAALQGALIGLVASQSLWVTALETRPVERVPSPGVIRATLDAPRREPCNRAWQLDQALSGAAPDAETRDGLGEVAAWVYRLSWTLQALDREIETIDNEPLDARIAAAGQAVSTSEDSFTRERRQAALRHLEQLQAHRAALGLERERLAALVDYALAFLEQARAGLALSRVKPGEHTPERLGEVLGRLRSHSLEEDAQRRTARQLNALA